VSKHFSLLNSTSSPSSLCSALHLLFAPAGAPSGTVGFDLPGPQIEVRVTRAGEILPIAQVPNLQAGDRVWGHPNLPDEQSVRHVLVAAFLRAATNPPPESWFTRRKRGTSRCARKGSFSTFRKRVATPALSGSRDHRRFQHPALSCPAKARSLRQSLEDLNRASLARSRLDGHLNAIRDLLTAIHRSCTIVPCFWAGA
jgi:hypothetical protein